MILADCGGRSLTRHLNDLIPHDQRWQLWATDKEIRQNFSHPVESAYHNRKFLAIHLFEVDRKKLSSDPPSLGVISESFRLIRLLDTEQDPGYTQFQTENHLVYGIAIIDLVRYRSEGELPCRPYSDALH